MKRSQMTIDRVYYETQSEQYAVTPDCVGVYWYDTRDEAFDQHGEQKVYSVSEIED